MRNGQGHLLSKTRACIKSSNVTVLSVVLIIGSREFTSMYFFKKMMKIVLFCIPVRNKCQHKSS